jgi:predicted dehydrogenase
MSAVEPVELGVAIVGAGIIGDNHARAITAVPGLRVVALVDPSREQLAAVARTLGELGQPPVAQLASLDDALALPEVDLVAICTPSGLHVPLAEQAIAAGKHVLIEKPLDVDLDRARRFAEVARAAADRGIVVSVVSQHRFDDASERVDAAVASGEFGRLTSGVASIAWWRPQSYYDSADWRGTWQLDGGGAAMNQGIHTIDLLLWYFGRPALISARTALLAHTGIEVEDTLAATVVFESGALGLIHTTTAAYPGVAATLAIYGSAGSAVIENDALTFFRTSQTEERPEAASAQPVGGPGTGHEAQYADLLDAIRHRRPPRVTVDDALLALATVRALYESAASGETVEFAKLLD